MTADDSFRFLVDRRSALIGVVAAMAAPGTVLAQAEPPRAIADPSVDGAAFDRARLIEFARDLARKPFVAPNVTLPDGLGGLNFETYNGIRLRPERALFAGEAGALVVEPLHRGFVFQTPVTLSIVEAGLARRVSYSPAAYDFGKLTPPPSSVGDIGFSGARIMLRGNDGTLRFVAAFQGASLLRSLARGQTAGAISRALSLRTADQRGEEFPFFRSLWIERPGNDDVVIVHALVDSPSATGAFAFTIRIGEVTLVDTEAAIFARVALDNFGIAGMQASFLFGWTDRRGVDDTRTAVHEVSGLQMMAGNGEWIWRPVTNPKQLQVSSFAMANPRGFGLVQRDRAFASYNDHDGRYDLRPSLWIEPIGEWQQGAVQLVEIPSESEVNDNIIALWRPKDPVPAGGEVNLAYRQHWCWSPPERPNLAQVTGTRIGRAAQRRRRFIVDLAGDRLAGLKPADLQAALWASNNGISNTRIVPLDGDKSLRVSFDLDPGSETLIELRLALTLANAPVSETWLYRWTP